MEVGRQYTSHSPHPYVGGSWGGEIVTPGVEPTRSVVD